MTQLKQPGYLPLYVSLAACFILVLLLLRPDQALGLSVDVVASKNGDASQSMFAQGEDVTIDIEVDLEGREEELVSATFEVRQVEGQPGFTGMIIELPTEEGGYVTGGPPEGVDPDSVGSARLNVAYDGISPGSSGSAMSYSGGKIVYSIIYSPPEIGGDYTATVHFKTARDEQESLAAFSIDHVVILTLQHGRSALWWIIPLIVGGALLVTGAGILLYVKGRRGI